MDGGGALFGEALQRHRHAQRLTQAELAEKAGLSERTISDLERGLKHPQRATVRLLTRALGLPPAQAEDLEMAARTRTSAAEPIARSAAGHNLPAALTSFVGREQELIEVSAPLSTARLLTLTGVGGCGKTRLALEVARDAVPRYVDGVWLVELGPVPDPMLVPGRVAGVLGVNESPDEPVTTSLIAALASRNMLLVLDNCEHLLQACAVLVDALLRSCPDLHILATSREPLGIAGEVAWRVPSLAVPDSNRSRTLAEVVQSPAVQLFVERAVAVQPHFILTERNSAAVVRICQRLDGIPLALELAAARMVALTPAQVVDRLDRSFRLLTGGSRVALPRQQTLQAALDWSYDLLLDGERRVFECLAVFAGDWTLEAAEAVCADGEPVAVEDVLDLCVSLVRKSLVVATEAADGAQRYRLLETVREYARQKLAARGVAEASAARERHAVFYSEEVERLYPGMWRYGSVVWASANVPADRLRERIEQMQDNLRAALAWWTAERRAAEGLRLAVTLCQFWLSYGAHAETWPWLEPMRELATGDGEDENTPAQVPVALRMRALSVLGSTACSRGQYAESSSFLQECVVLSREAGDASHLARTLAGLGRTLWLAGARDRGTALLEEGLQMGREVGDPLALGLILVYLADVEIWQGQHESAAAHLRACLDALEWPATHRGLLVASALARLGRSAYLEGQSPAAASYLHQAIGAMRESRLIGRYLAESLEWLAGIEGAEGQPGRAARLFGAAEAWRLASGAVRHAPEQTAFERDVADVRAQLTEAELTAARAEGRAMTYDEILDYALEGVPHQEVHPG
jgi:non-specific serine/threonine protein kinase